MNEEQIPEQGVIVFGIPDVPYSSVRVPLGDDRMYEALSHAEAFRAAYLETFGAASAPGPQETPQERRTAAPQQNASTAPGGAPFGVRVTCPEHNADCRPSKKNPNKDFVEELGREIPASWFHSLPDGKTHSVWRSAAQIEALS